MVIFRPALWMTVLMVPVLLALLCLGTWQVSRLQWKESLIDEFTLRVSGEAVAPPVVDNVPESRFQRLRLRGVWLHDVEVQLTGRTFEGTAGYHVITPMRLEDDRILLVNRGWVGEKYRRPETRPSTLAKGAVDVEAILRLPALKGYFVPENDIDGDDWFTLNIADINSHHNLGDTLITTYTADVLRPLGPYVMPIGAAVEINIPNNHLHYAITWYGIALGLIGVYLTWHYQAGRLAMKGK